MIESLITNVHQLLPSLLSFKKFYLYSTVSLKKFIWQAFNSMIWVPNACQLAIYLRIQLTDIRDMHEHRMLLVTISHITLVRTSVHLRNDFRVINSQCCCFLNWKLGISTLVANAITPQNEFSDFFLRILVFVFFYSFHGNKLNKWCLKAICFETTSWLLANTRNMDSGPRWYAL